MAYETYDGARERLGPLFRKARLGRGMGQEEFARLIGKHVQTVIAFERSRRLPSLTTFFSMCEALGVSPEIFMREIAAIGGGGDNDGV